MKVTIAAEGSINNMFGPFIPSSVQVIWQVHIVLPATNIKTTDGMRQTWTVVYRWSFVTGEV